MQNQYTSDLSQIMPNQTFAIMEKKDQAGKGKWMKILSK